MDKKKKRPQVTCDADLLRLISAVLAYKGPEYTQPRLLREYLEPVLCREFPDIAAIYLRREGEGRTPAETAARLKELAEVKGRRGQPKNG